MALKVFSFLLFSYSATCPPCAQVVCGRLQMTQGLLQKTVEEQGASEAVGDKLCKKAAFLMDDIAALAARYYMTSSAIKNTSFKHCQTCYETIASPLVHAAHAYF